MEIGPLGPPELPLSPALAGTPASPRDAGAALQEFESLFMHTLLKQARSTEDEDGIIPKSPGRDLVHDLFDSMMAKEIARSGGLGVAEVLRQQLNLDAPKQAPAGGDPARTSTDEPNQPVEIQDHDDQGTAPASRDEPRPGA